MWVSVCFKIISKYCNLFTELLFSITGKRFGLWQTKIGIATVIRNFKVTLSEKMKVPLKFDTPGLILKAKGDVWLNFEKTDCAN